MSASLVKEVARGNLGAFYAVLDQIALDNNYQGGYSLANVAGIGTVLGASAFDGNAAANAYEFRWSSVDNKLHVFEAAGATPAGSVTVTVAGSQSAGAALQISPATGNAGVLGTTTAQATQTIPGSTFGIAFTGTAGAKAAFVEVPNGTDLNTLRITLLILGY